MHQPFILFVLQKFASYSGIIPILFAVIYYNALDKPLKVIFYFVLFSFLVNLINIYLSGHGIHNLFIFHFYAIFEFGFVLWFFSSYVDGVLKKIIIPLVGLFAVLSIVNFSFIQNGLQLNTYTRPIEAITITLYCIAFFNHQTLSETERKWSSVGTNWAVIALLIYYSGNFFIFIFANYFLDKNAIASPYFWAVYNLLLLVENLLFATAFYNARRQSVLAKQGR